MQQMISYCKVDKFSRVALLQQLAYLRLNLVVKLFCSQPHTGTRASEAAKYIQSRKLYNLRQTQKLRQGTTLYGCRLGSELQNEGWHVLLLCLVQEDQSQARLGMRTGTHNVQYSCLLRIHMPVIEAKAICVYYFLFAFNIQSFCLLNFGFLIINFRRRVKVSRIVNFQTARLILEPVLNEFADNHRQTFFFEKITQTAV